MTHEDALDTGSQFNLDTKNGLRCQIDHIVIALKEPEEPTMSADETKTTEQPPIEVTVNGHLYRLVDGDPIRARVRMRANEIKALRKEHVLTFEQALAIAKP